MGNEISCCRAPSSKKALGRDKISSKDISLTRNDAQKSPALENDITNSKKRRRKKFLDAKVLDNYVFARDSRISRAEDSKHRESERARERQRERFSKKIIKFSRNSVALLFFCFLLFRVRFVVFRPAGNNFACPCTVRDSLLYLIRGGVSFRVSSFL